MATVKGADRATRGGDQGEGWFWVNSTKDKPPTPDQGRVHESDPLTVHLVGPQGEDLGAETYPTPGAMAAKWEITNPQPSDNAMPVGYVAPPYDNPAIKEDPKTKQPEAAPARFRTPEAGAAEAYDDPHIDPKDQPRPVPLKPENKDQAQPGATTVKGAKSTYDEPKKG